METRKILEKEISIPQAKSVLDRGSFFHDDIFMIENVQKENLPMHIKDVKCVTLIFCEEGRFRYEIDGHTAFADVNDVSILGIGQRVDNYKVLTPTFKGKAILIKADKIHFLAEDFCNVASLTRTLRNIDTIRLNQQEVENCNTFFAQAIRILAKANNEKQFAFTINLLKLILQLILNSDSCQLSKERISHSHTAYEDLYDKFLELCYENVLVQKPISFYYKELGISGTTLIKIVYKYAGITPLKLLHNLLIRRICLMAECTADQSLSISQIAKRAHFQSASALSNFVKRNINMNLSHFRKLKSAEQHRIIPHTIFDRNAALKDLPKIYKQEDSAPSLS